MKINKKLLCCVLFFGIITTSNAQFWKKIQKKLEKKAEQKLEEKIDKEADKIIDSTLYGKKKEKSPKKVLEDDRLKSYGSASINHSTLYGMFSVNDLTKTKVNKEGEKIKIIGYWRTSDADVFDGYKLILHNIKDINELKNKSLKIPQEASLNFAYNALVKGKYEYKRGQVHAPQILKVKSGTVTVSFNKDQNIIISFTGDVNLRDHSTAQEMLHRTPATISGMVNTTEPEYTITRERKEKQKNSMDDISEDEKMEMLQKMSPTVNIPSTFSFHKSIEVKMTDERGDAQTIAFLTGNYPDIYGMFVAHKEMQGQEMLIVNTPKTSTMFMNMGGMKIKKSTSLEQLGDQYGVDNKIPEEGDFEYKKTGNTKTIISYLCEEVKVDYEYTDQKGSTSFWLSKDFPIQNKALPMLGMKMNNPNFSGFVLEMNTIQNGNKFTIEVTGVSDKNVSINTNEYKKMGF